ncbi:hypothetical protein [Microbacterium immunditiarum]|uniref:Na+/proline symporter n=1 Tax=Microbacterium immunditiarum TaxID=337480 RepID=A0A7Y9GQX6_9MICO|nr:hypothetical protein [Microbacterium immunditiarum]NYE19925.1 Na+/proline symporter [Microbacterium immunditiarum]
MQILLGLIVGACIGVALHFAVPGRSTRGVALAPVLGALVAGLAWMILTWAGQGVDSLWIWLAAFVAPAVTVWPTLVVLARMRDAHDERERERLRIA